MVGFTRHFLLYSVFFTVVYISNSLVLGAVFSIISISVLFIPYLPPVLALNMSLLLTSKTALDLDPVVVELGFIPKAIYHYSLMG